MPRRFLSLLLLSASAALAAPIPERAIELRNLGLAQLENERAAEAEASFRRLAQAVPDDPLPYANLAVAALRQQKSEEALRWIGQALSKAPGRADLLTIQGDVLQWSGRMDEALAAYRKAAAAAPADPEIQYALYRQAESTGDDAAMAESLGRLVRLRPENLVVLLQSGRRAVQGGDRPGATRAFLRVRELLWQAPPSAGTSLEQVLGALEKGDVASARGPAARLENVLKPTPAYQQSLRELLPGIQALPVERFAQEPPPSMFGNPMAVRFQAAALATGPTAAVAVGDFDGDERPDIVRVTSSRLEIRRGNSWKAGPAASGITGLLAADLDNDGRLDLVGHGSKEAVLWHGQGDGSFADATAAAGLGNARGEAAAVLDFDLEGDLDLVTAGSAAELYRNPLQGAFEAVGKEALPGALLTGARALTASDLDRDGDPDLAVAGDKGLLWIDNLRQGNLADRTAASGLGRGIPAAAVASTDLDADGFPDLIAAGQGLTLWHNRRGRFEPWRPTGLPAGRFAAVAVLDADNDGRLDLAAAGPGGVVVLAQRGPRGRLAFAPLPVAGARAATSLAVTDLDGDGDLDLVAAGPAGVQRLDNQGGNRNHWLTVRLHGLAQGSGKNNRDGLGATVELRAGSAYQFREVTGQVTHLGLGQRRQADLLRVVWTNGVPQNRIQPKGEQRVVEEQVLKGSCPFLYTWDGERFAFVTDLLWNAPMGLPVAPGKWVPADPEELVRVDGAKPDGGVYRLRVTEELWEAAFFDHTRLWVVDHPATVEVASSLRVTPGMPPAPGEQPDRVLASRGLRPVVSALDGTGADVTDRVRERDEVYAGGYPASSYQGMAGEPWTFTFDLGQAPGRPLRLHLDGWIFPADASLNLAAAQRPDLAYVPPRLEVETADGWQVLVPAMGHPAGKTKTLVVDTPPLPAGASRLRIVTTLWLAWDRIAWTPNPADAEPVVRARLLPSEADLRYRGFSELVRRSPNGPHGYDYDRATTDSPWLPFPGRYTRYGDVRELLAEPDDRTVILAPGDEIALAFDASYLPPVPEGWTRTVFLESHGWDKDADRNTWEAQQMEPLPFRGMSGYPYAPGETYPDTPALREYQEKWLTREAPTLSSLKNP